MPDATGDMTPEEKAEIADWLKQIDIWYERLLPRFPKIDPHDLRMISDLSYNRPVFRDAG